MKTRWIILIGSIFLLTIIAAFASNNPTATTVFSTKPHGVRAFFLALEQQGWDPEVLLYPFSKLKEQQKSGTLFIVAPPEMGGEQDLMNWVKEGNTVVYLDDLYSNDESTLRIALMVKQEDSIEQLLTTTKFNPPGKEPRLAITTKCQLPGTECLDVKQLSSPAGWIKEQLEYSIVATDEKGARVLTKPHGAGRIWYFAGSEPIQNQFIDQADNFRLLYQIATNQGGNIIFDEFHHGYLPPPDAGKRGSIYNLIILAIYLVVVLILMAIFRSVRFGPAQPAPVLASRSTAEFSAVLGSLYAEHGSYEVLQSYINAWRTRVIRRLGISRWSSNAEIVTQITNNTRISYNDQEKLRTVLNGHQGSAKQLTQSSIQFLEQIICSIKEHHHANRV